MKTHVCCTIDFGYVLVMKALKEEGTLSKIGPFPNRESARHFYNQEKVTPYLKDGMMHFFREHGPLMLFRPIASEEFITPDSETSIGMHEVVLNIENIVKTGIPIGAANDSDVPKDPDNNDKQKKSSLQLA